MNVLIVDDEPPARARLRQLLEESGKHTVVGEAQNGQQALNLCAKLLPDVVLLDISMPGISGIETARHLNALERPPAVIFTTAYDEYAIEAFDARAIGYVLKPVRRERLERALEHATRLGGGRLRGIDSPPSAAGGRQHVCARARGELKLIPVADIDYFLADQKYVRVRHCGGEDLLDDSLKTLEEEFSDRFVRIHRGALVAVQKIDALRRSSDGRLEVSLRTAGDRDKYGGGDRLVISRRHLAEVRRRVRGS
ncbi:MAG TPA: LytTR family DNA-binding domain-containing protein [Woeseiaceae bacterium]|nr:LytTR family DNA-binding domain-containing protein [Woeseiaceae bacterium]